MTTPARRLTVVDPGPLTLVQDAGRHGYAHLGVPRAGWLDGSSATLANRLVGNLEGDAVLESLVGGLVLRARNALTVAVTGAEAAVSVGGRPVEHSGAVSMAVGQELVLGRATRGARCYVAVSGGIRVEAVLGSRSTDTLSGLGPAPLRSGDVIPVGPPHGKPSGTFAVRRTPGGPAQLHCSLGPRSDWFTTEALQVLGSSTYTVQPESDRVALRLDGGTLERARPGELPSEGLVLGAVQVPPDGRPLVFLNDHPRTGGYPVVAVVARRDLGRCAQLLPGDQVRFTTEGPTPPAAPAPGRPR